MEPDFVTIIAIDFEASCLPRHGRSYPIEVGIAGDGIERSWLIAPHADWAGWDWTAEAQALHGLTREQIVQDGLPPAQVLGELALAVGGRRVVADSLIDRYWLATLAGAVGEPAPFVIHHAADLFDEHGADAPRISAAMAFADMHSAVRHRAIADARWLAALIGHLTGGTGALLPA